MVGDARTTRMDYNTRSRSTPERRTFSRHPPSACVNYAPAILLPIFVMRASDVENNRCTDFVPLRDLRAFNSFQCRSLWLCYTRKLSSPCFSQTDVRPLTFDGRAHPAQVTERQATRSHRWLPLQSPSPLDTKIYPVSQHPR